MSAQVLVLLGCRIEPDGRPCAAGRRRALCTHRAFVDGVAPRVIVSGGRRWHGHAEALALAEELRALGVPPHAISLELCSLSTCENARYVATIMRREGLDDAVVVTCDWHLPRALESFELAGVRVAGLAAPSPRVSSLRSARRSLRERASALLDRVSTFGWHS